MKWRFWRRIKVSSKTKKPQSALSVIPLPSTRKLHQIFKDLDCPICFNTCVPPVTHCTNGHIICFKCKKSCIRCPTCRGSFSESRNLFVDNFIVEYSQPCKYANQGCDFIKWKGTSIRAHQSNCHFRPIKCFLPLCTEFIDFQSFMQHLTTDHKINGSDNSIVRLPYRVDDSVTMDRMWTPFYMNTEGNLFFIIFELVRPNFWIWIWVQILDAEAYNENMFDAVIRIRNLRAGIDMTYQGPVHSVRTPGKTIRKDGIALGIPENMLNRLAQDSCVALTVHIRKTRFRRGPTAPNLDDIETTNEVTTENVSQSRQFEVNEPNCVVQFQN